MNALTNSTAIAEKTRELCQAILDDPAFRSAQQQIQAFVADEQARSAYEVVVSEGEELRRKQDRGEIAGDDEVATFERKRESLMRNPVAMAFVDAQSELHEVRKAVEQQVSLTLELGRLPSAEDLGGGCGCDSGCGCHGH